MNQKDKRNLFIGIVTVTVLAVITFFVMTNRADATYTPEETVEECVEVSAPDPIEFSKKIGFFNVTHQWQESPEGTWKLYKDLDPRGGHTYWVYTGDKIVENDCPEPEVPELPTPPSPYNDGRSSNPDATKPFVCPTGDTTGVVANPHVWRNGTSATVNFFITEGNSAHIFWSVVGEPHWGNAVANVKPNGDNFVSYTVNDLDPNLGYDFGIQQVEGCSGGKVTAVVVDGPEPQLFTLSYYE